MTAYTDGQIVVNLSEHTECPNDERIAHEVIVFDPLTHTHYFTLISRHQYLAKPDLRKEQDRIYRKGIPIEICQH